MAYKKKLDLEKMWWGEVTNIYIISRVMSACVRKSATAVMETKTVMTGLIFTKLGIDKM